MSDFIVQISSSFTWLYQEAYFRLLCSKPKKLNKAMIKEKYLLFQILQLFVKKRINRLDIGIKDIIKTRNSKMNILSSQ